MATALPGSSSYELRDPTSGLVATIDPSFGGEITSLTFKGRELVYRSAEGWRGGTPVLFPAVGRQKDGRYSLVKGQPSLDMPLHGFVHDDGSGGKPQSFRVLAGDEDNEDEEDATAGGPHLTLLLDSSSVRGVAKDKNLFPFAFSLMIRYSLRGGLLVAKHTVTRAAAGGEGTGPSLAPASVPMPSAIGNHLTLAVPPESWPSSRIQGCVWRQHELTPDNLVSGKTQAVKEMESAGWVPLHQPGGTNAGSFTAARLKSGLPLTSPIATNAVLGLPDAEVSQAEAANAACAMQLLMPDQGLAVEVSQQVTEVTRSSGAGKGEGGSVERPSWEEISASRLFVLWGDKSKGFICLEPWLTGPDSLNTRKGLPMLLPGEQISWSYAVQVAEIAAEGGVAGAGK